MHPSAIDLQINDLQQLIAAMIVSRYKSLQLELFLLLNKFWIFRKVEYCRTANVHRASQGSSPCLAANSGYEQRLHRGGLLQTDMNFYIS